MRSASEPRGTAASNAENMPQPIVIATAAAGAPSAVRARGIDPMGRLRANSKRRAETTKTA